MKHQLLSILVCPEDKAELTVSISAENDVEILSGTLTCSICNAAYPIDDGIPNLLPQAIRQAQTE